MSEPTSDPIVPARRTVLGPVAALGAVVASAAALVLAPVVVGGSSPAAAAPLERFAGCGSLTDWFADAARAQLRWGWVGPYPMPATDGAEAAAGADFASETTGAGATGTNVQEAGVDEPDAVKTDGARVVTVYGDRLYVADVSGGTPRQRGSVRLPVGEGQELLLVGERALVLGSAWDEGVVASDAPVVDTGRVALTVVDLADPATPEVVRVEEVGGHYLSARESDGVVRIVTASTPTLPYVYANGTRDQAAANQANLRLIASATAQDWLPQRVRRDADGDVIATEPLLDCDQVSHPAAPSGLGVLSVVTLDLAAPDAPLGEPVAVAADGEHVYASLDRLYVATTRGGWGSWAGDVAPSPEVSTELHGFDLAGRETVRYLGSGAVDGWLLGRWALSAQDGYLRVATTRLDDSAVTVLAEMDGGLRLVGSVAGLGPGEQIRSVRWFGDLATVVTFRQTDPLYTVDLSDPAAPRVVGELKVTGYSGYLHPLGDGLLLGVGQQATEQGDITGALVSVFDLTRLDRPALVSTVEEPFAWAHAESDSRAFVYLPDLRLAVTPLSSTSEQLWAVAIDPAGRVSTAGRWSLEPGGWPIRAVPVDGERLALVTVTNGRLDLTVLRLPDLGQVGNVVLR